MVGWSKCALASPKWNWQTTPIAMRRDRGADLSERSHYTFGDLGPAAERLRRLALLYQPVSRLVLEQACGLLDTQPDVAIDLGAGPGYTTELVAHVTQARVVVGYERSPVFCAHARARCGETIDFVELDVGTADLPIRDVDLGFCRFLLTHLANPVEVLGRWRKALRAGGVMVLLEVEHLSSSDPVLARYYQIIEGVQAQHGQAMSIGKNLDTMAAKAGWRAVDSRAVDPGLSASSMATLHLPNLETIRKEAWVKSQFSPEELAELAEGLERIGAETGEETSIDSVLRVVIARV